MTDKAKKTLLLGMSRRSLKSLSEIDTNARSCWCMRPPTGSFRRRISKRPGETPLGMISRMAPFPESRALFLIPYEVGVDTLDMREIHQIVKELTIGIFVFNQTPNISLEPNFDQSSSCQIPPAYQDTRVGQLLINVDYMLKALWHGA